MGGIGDVRVALETEQWIEIAPRVNGTARDDWFTVNTKRNSARQGSTATRAFWEHGTV
jgi:hypothetical protein